MTIEGSSGKAILLSLERLLDAADIVSSGDASSAYDLEVRLRVTNRRAQEMIRALAMTGLAFSKNGHVSQTPMMRQFLRVWELGDDLGMSDVLFQYRAYGQSLQYLSKFKSCPLIKGAPPWLARSGDWRRARTERKALRVAGCEALRSLGLGTPRGWDEFRQNLELQAGRSATSAILIDYHLVKGESDFDHSARYFFQWLTMPEFGINPAALDQMGHWAHTLSRAYKAPNMLYWGGENPSPEAFGQAIDQLYADMSPTGDFVPMAELQDLASKTLFISPRCFEVTMLKYIELHADLVSISGGVGLERRGIGTVCYDLRPRSQGPPWFEHRWLADGLRTAQGNIKFVRLENSHG